MAEIESQPTPDASQEHENPASEPTINPEPEGTGEAPSTSQDDTTNKLTALEAQLAREKERNSLLERSLQYQERFQQQAQPAVPAKPEEAWAPELDVLDKALDPLLKKRFNQMLDPITQNYTSLVEEADALRFENFLTRNNPEVLEDEDSYSRTMQQVEAIRQAATQRGMKVSRIDAFVFNEGLQGTKQKITSRKAKRTTAGQAETRRQAEVQAAQGTSQSGAPRAPANAGIQAIREKANRGERLTSDERTKLRDFVSNVQL